MAIMSQLCRLASCVQNENAYAVKSLHPLGIISLPNNLSCSHFLSRKHCDCYFLENATLSSTPIAPCGFLQISFIFATFLSIMQLYTLIVHAHAVRDGKVPGIDKGKACKIDDDCLGTR